MKDEGIDADGLEVVKAIERLGSDNGRTRQKIEVVDCGQIA